MHQDLGYLPNFRQTDTTTNPEATVCVQCEIKHVFFCLSLIKRLFNIKIKYSMTGRIHRSLTKTWMTQKWVLGQVGMFSTPPLLLLTLTVVLLSGGHQKAPWVKAIRRSFVHAAAPIWGKVMQVHSNMVYKPLCIGRTYKEVEWGSWGVKNLFCLGMLQDGKNVAEEMNICWA